ncbi:MAG: hypothetical protein IPJ97_16740 [Proteobacteria bacterium]|nr:hypothetical protein [Pseudomonadota bacterium]
MTLEALQTSSRTNLGADRTGASILVGHNCRHDFLRLDMGLWEVRQGRGQCRRRRDALPSYTSIYNLNPPGSITGGAFSNGAFANGALSNNEFTTARARLSARLNPRSTGYVEGDVGLDSGGASWSP